MARSLPAAAPLFPAVSDAASIKYSSSLKQFMKKRATNGLAERAKALLDTFEKKG